jgi:hypothetical protein
MNTEPVVLTSIVSDLTGDVTHFYNTASQSTVLKNGCIRMEHVSLRAPRQCLRSMVRNGSNKTQLIYSPVT